MARPVALLPWVARAGSALGRAEVCCGAPLYNTLEAITTSRSDNFLNGHHGLILLAMAQKHAVLLPYTAQERLPFCGLC